jgi:hypothetical protein
MRQHSSRRLASPITLVASSPVTGDLDGFGDLGPAEDPDLDAGGTRML